MAQLCKVCTHPELESINKAIVAGVSNRVISVQFNISHNSVQRHRTNHLPEHLALSKQAEEITQADGLVGDLQFLRTVALDFLDQAKQANDTRVAAPLITSACRVIETLAEVRGELDRKQTVNILINPEFVAVRTLIMDAVQDCPLCRKRLSEALKHV